MRRIFALVALSALAAGSTPSANASHATPRAMSARDFLYEPTPTTIGAGDHLRFTNHDAVPHDVVSRLNRSDGVTPLFRSSLVANGESAPVVGVEELAPGNYPFYCTIHVQMAGTLVVATAVPSPTIPELPTASAVAAVPTPTSVTVHEGSLYVSSYTADTVYQLEILEGGATGPAVSYVTGVERPLGVVMADDGTLFVSDSHPAATDGRTTVGRVWAVPPGGGDVADVGQVVIDELPNGRHNTNGMAIHGGRLHITNGNSTDDGVDGGPPEEPLSGTIISVPISTRDMVIGQTPTEGLVVEANGMRNVYDVAFRPGTTEAWFAMNGLDEQDPWGEDLLLKADTAWIWDPEEERLVVPPPEDYGFPGCVYAAGFEQKWGQNRNPEVADTCDGEQVMPEQLMGLHTSADGLAFGPEGGYWHGDLFVALFGNFFGDEVVGHEVVRVPIDAQGRSGPPEDLLPGVTPLDVTFWGNDMYVADFSAGVLLVKPPG